MPGAPGDLVNREPLDLLHPPDLRPAPHLEHCLPPRQSHDLARLGITPDDTAPRSGGCDFNRPSRVIVQAAPTQPQIDGAGDPGRFGATSGGPLYKASVCRTGRCSSDSGRQRTTRRQGRSFDRSVSQRAQCGAAGIAKQQRSPRSCSSATRIAVLGIVTARATTDAEVRDHAGPDPATRSLRPVARAPPPPAHAEHRAARA
jgi:hypothetical protein